MVNDVLYKAPFAMKRALFCAVNCTKLHIENTYLRRFGIEPLHAFIVIIGFKFKAYIMTLQFVTGHSERLTAGKRVQNQKLYHGKYGVLFDYAVIKLMILSKLE